MTSYNFLKFLEKNLNTPIILILLIIGFLKNITNINFDYLWSEVGIIENLQILILVLGLLKTVQYSNHLKKVYGKLMVNLKIIFFSILLNEEASYWISKLIKFDKIKSFNLQNELNIHNAKILHLSIQSNLPFTDGEIHLITFFIISLLLFISFGSLLGIKSKIKIFIFEKEYLYFGLIYFSNLIASFILRTFNWIDTPLIIYAEIIELLFYWVLFLDSFTKTNNAINKNF